MPRDELSRPQPPTRDEITDGRIGPRRRKVAGIALAAVLAVAGTAAIPLEDDIRAAVQVVAADEPIVVSDKTVLVDLWRVYRDIHLEEGTGRTIDHQAGGITTSEGQSYTMLRAVWMDDQPTFAQSWQWTKDNLQREDRLLAWKFGERSDGSFGVQEQVGGGNSATDADVDIAFALLMAYSRWQDDDYLDDALPLIEAIWQQFGRLHPGRAGPRRQRPGAARSTRCSSTRPTSRRTPTASSRRSTPSGTGRRSSTTPTTCSPSCSSSRWTPRRPPGLPPNWVAHRPADR